MDKIGIDFGTTKTLVSYYDSKKHEPKLVRLGRGKDEIPTTIYIDKDKNILIGEDADDSMLEDPQNYTSGRSFKLGLGNDDVILNGKTAKDLVVLFLAEIKKRCEEEVFCGDKLKHVVITVPVKFSAKQKDDLKEAARKAGFTKVELLKEPEAAGRAFLEEGGRGITPNILVLDWGGGTVDVAILKKELGEYKSNPKYVWGNDEIGGEVFDEILFDEIRLYSEIEFNERNKRRIREIKEILSTKSSYTIRITNKGNLERIEISRLQFENLIEKNIKEVANSIKNLLKKVSTEDLPKEIILIGGTCKIPLIKKIIEAETGLSCIKWQYSHESVALGASLFEEIDKKVDKTNNITLSKQFDLTPDVMQELHEISRIIYVTTFMEIGFHLAINNKIFMGQISENMDFIKNLKDANDDNYKVTIVNECIASLKEFVENESPIPKFEFLDSGIKDLKKTFSTFKQRNTDLETELLNHEKKLKSIENKINKRMRKLSEEWDSINDAVIELDTNYSRYNKIKTSSSIWWNLFKWGLGIAFTPATLGMSLVGVAIWQHWDQMSDVDFEKSYLDTLVKTIVSIAALWEKIENVIISNSRKIEDFSLDIERYLVELCRSGYSINSLKDYFIDSSIDNTNPMTHLMTSMSIELIKKNNFISPKDLDIYVKSLIKVGFLLNEDGSLNEKEYNKLI